MFFGTDSKNILDKKDRIKTTKNKNEVNFIIKQQSLIIAKLTSFLFLINGALLVCSIKRLSMIK